jgi:hippurate hydrolase
MGHPIHRGLGKTGVVGIVKGGGSRRAIGLRADMDALPMQEFNTFAHASRTRQDARLRPRRPHRHAAGGGPAPGKHRNFDGTVYLIFQPAEEGGGGAREMIKDGLFEQFPMEAVFGMHNWPGMPVGSSPSAPAR